MSNKQIQERWLQLTEEKNAIDYLEKVNHFSKEIDKQIVNWKWIIIALHGALYGFAICSAKGTNPDTVCRTLKNGKKILINFAEAIKRCKEGPLMLVTSRHLTLSKTQEVSLDMLSKEFRNYFEHYIPLGWSIEVHGFPRMVLDMMEIVRFLVFDSPNYAHYSDSDREKVERLISEIEENLRCSETYGEAKELMEI